MSYPQNNNPGDLRYSGIPWRGLANPPEDDDGFCVFITLEDGIRSLAEDLINQMRLHGLRTIRSVVEKFAPPAENDTQKYINDLVEWTGYGPDEELDLESPAIIERLLPAVVRQERGVVLDSELTMAAILDAFRSLGISV